MNQTNLTSQKRKPAPPANPLVEGAKIILGSGFGLFFAVLLLSYFWGIDLLGMQGKAKRDQQQVASVPPPAPVAPAAPAASTPPAATPPEKKVTPPGLTPEEIQAAIQRPAPAARSLPQPPPEPTPAPEQPTSPPEPASVSPAAKVNTPASPSPAPEPSSETPDPKLAPAVPGVPKNAKGAWISVARMRPWQIPREVEVPDSLRNGTAFIWQEKPRSANLELGELQLMVTKTGVVMLAENWKSQGGGGDWQKTALSREQLIAQGWEPCGTVNWPPVPAEETMQLELFQKVCQKGEVYKIRTNKYWPPFVFVPPTK